MRVSNDPPSAGGDPRGPSGAFAELFRLQSEFQARLAEETLRYLRRLQGAVVPASPGTVVLPSDGLALHAEAAPGARAELGVEIENLQRVHCMVSPQLTPLVSAEGVTWFPEAESGSGSRLLAPGATERLALGLAVPPGLPAGEYRGALVLQGFRRNAVPVTVTVRAPAAAADTAAEPLQPTKPTRPRKPKTPSPPTTRGRGGPGRRKAP